MLRFAVVRARLLYVHLAFELVERHAVRALGRAARVLRRVVVLLLPVLLSVKKLEAVVRGGIVSLKRWSEGGAVRCSSVKRRDCDGITAFGTVSVERPRAVSDPEWFQDRLVEENS